MLIGPDQIAIGLKPRQFSCPRTGGQNDVLGSQLLSAFVGFDADFTLGRDRCLSHHYGHFIFLQQVTDTTGKLPGDAARPLYDGVQIVADLVRLQAEILGALH